jgi:hypothetical protein
VRGRASTRRPASGGAAPGRAPRPPAQDVQQLGRWIGNRALTGVIGAAIQRAPVRPVVAARGTNPGDAIRALRVRKPTSARDAQKVANEWLAAVRKILNAANAGTTGSSHAAEIVQNELAELANDEAALQKTFADLKAGKAAIAFYKDAIDTVTSRRAAEIALEFRHNVLLRPGQAHTVTKQGNDEVATPAGALEWGRGDLTMLDKALEGIPADATRGNPHAVSFLRGDFEVAGGRPDRRLGGVTSGTAPEITMYDRGMQPGEWGRVEAPGVRNPAYVHTPRHELGHVVQQRLTGAEKAQLFTTIMKWEQYPLALLNDEANDRSSPKWRASLRQETGLDDAGVGRLITSVQAPPASRFHGARRAQGGRTYFKSDGFLHSVGNPAELPTGPEFDYCYDNQSEYVADLYAFAIARPAWLASKLSQGQIKWFKEVMFRVPTDAADLVRQIQPPAAVQAQFVNEAATLFTWEQLDARLAELLTAQRAAPAPARVP